MGCVLGKQSQSSSSDIRHSRNTQAPPRNLRRRRSSDESSLVVSVNDSVDGVVAVKEKRGERQQQRKAGHTGDFQVMVPSPDKRRMIPETDTNGWPSWLMAVAGEAISDLTPRRANTFQKLDKIGQGTYSNVYKARDLLTGKIVALKKVRFDNLEPESVEFMAREILVLRKLDHPNVIKLEGLVTSRMSCSLYLVFEYMEHDLAGLAACQEINFTEPQVKCYMKQLLSGLEHCHKNGVLHRDIKGSNLLIDNEGILKIADFGLATTYDPGQKKPLTSRVVTLWYRPPELLIGATYYGVGVDLWSAGCILAELLSGKPIMPGRTEVEQLRKIFKLCGSPSEEYWKKSKLANATLFKPQHPYKCCIAETFKDFPSSLSLIETLLSIDPEERSTATAALNGEFFKTEPFACEPSTLPKYPPCKEIDAKLRDAEARQRSLAAKVNAVDGTRRIKVHKRPTRAVPAPEANAETQANLDKWRVMTQTNAKSKSEKFPPPHQDGAVGHPVDASNKGPVSFGAKDTSFSSSIFNSKSSGSAKRSTHAGGPSRRKTNRDSQSGRYQKSMLGFKPSSIGISMDMLFKGKSKAFGSQN
ncbi:putative serine/threonine-protein kinase [Hibiscus syriacus]|uniref:Serine/threonine-protein kinase n=1 Tax=Hibiscus syriacus TaxID=106335 RepID=A0A6A3AMF4_HIBSY|nr:probable serine/threonine-protein kinase At1g54610 [Hibiscus syriacus]KAE8705218.1 putative serine/threonine-protein kinase [Hibiscus syriacus]